MKKNEQEQLLDCPFCGVTEDDDCTHAVPYGEPGLLLHKVVCTCGASVEGLLSEAEAIAAWNARARPDASDVERDIRIAIWNGARWQGSTDEVAQSLIRKVMDEPTMKRALAALNPSPVQEEERG